MTAAAQVVVAFFANPCLFDDNFVNDWAGTATLTTDGDIATITTAGVGDFEIDYTFAAAENTNPNRYLTIRATALTGDHWHVKIYDGVVLKVNKEYSTTGTKEVDLYVENSSVHFAYDKVRIEVNGTAGQHVKIDFIVIGTAAMLIPTGSDDIIDKMEIVQPVLLRGISSAKLKINNDDGSYTGLVSENDVGLIYLYREGSAVKKVFGGRVVKPGYESSFTKNEYYLNIELHDHGYELLHPPALVNTRYTAGAGKTIITDAVDLCSYLTKEFVDVDNDIASTHDAEFNEVYPISVINKILKEGKTLAGVIGFEGYVDPAGNMNVFKRGKYDSTVLVDKTTILDYLKSTDIHRVVNKQKVYGEAEKKFPSDGDLCEAVVETEGTWSGESGNTTVAVDAVTVLVGTNSIKGSLTIAGPLIIIKFAFGVGYYPDCSYPPLGKYSKFVSYIYFDNTWREYCAIVLEDGNGDKVQRYMRTTWDEWVPIELPGSYRDQEQWSFWPGDTAFDWSDIRNVYFYVWTVAANDTGDIYVDGMHFGGRRYESEQEDATSQGDYGVRCGEPPIDESLASDAECELRAKSLIEYLKDPVTSIQGLVVIGDNDFLPGYRQLVVSAIDGINAYYRIVEIRHEVEFTHWTTTLIVNDEPQKIDHIFAEMQDDLKRLTGARGRGMLGAGSSGERWMGATRIVGESAIADYDFDTLQLAIDSIV